jgi:hypothetical protein
VDKLFPRDPELADEVGPEAPPRRRRLGCLGCGCLVVLVLLFLLAVLGVAGWWWVRRAVNEYTEDAPVAIPVVALRPAEKAELDRRVERFATAMEPNRPKPADSPTSITLTKDELNALIGEEPRLAGRAALVRIADGGIEGRLSLPLDELGMDWLRGRFLNGEFVLRPEVRDGQVAVSLERLVAGGKPVPGAVLGVVREILERAVLDESTAARLRRIESIDADDDRITLKARAEVGGDGPPLPGDGDDP